MRDYLRSFLKYNAWDVALFILILIETGFLLYYKKESVSYETNALCFTCSGIAVALVVFLKYFNKKVEGPSTVTRALWLRTAPLLFFIAGILYLCPALSDLFKKIPIDARYSDVIPTIQLAINRWLHGEWVYAGINEWGYSLPLTYLPMQWMPYAVAELLHFDYRWIAIGIYALSGATLVWICSQRSIGRSFSVAFLCWFLLSKILEHDIGILAMTVELMVAGYYMLFVLGMAEKNPWLKGLFIAVCLLSRYSLVLWLPLWAFVEWISGNRKPFLKAVGAIAFLVLILYVLPFLSQDSTLFIRGYKYYSQAALGEWNNMGEHGIPYQLDQGYGFARYYFLKSDWSLEDRIRSLQKMHLAVCLGSTFLFALFYLLIRHKIHPRIYLLITFKIYLCLFLAFIQVPYPYLMITAVAVSIAMLAASSRWRLKRTEA